MTVRIAVYNRASAPLGLDLTAFVAALNAFVVQAVAPAWEVAADLHVAPGPVKGEWGMVFLDNADAPGALAYHDEEQDTPLAKVFVDTIRQANASLAVAASHELVEMLVDPLCDCYAVTHDPQTLVAYEAADPVEDDSLGFDVAGFTMSDFVYPAWFDVTRAAGSTRFDHQGVLDRPLQVHSGGYTITLTNGAVSQNFGSKAKAQEFALEDRRGHRSELRRVKVEGVHR
jgi:hypothetical protein